MRDVDDLNISHLRAIVVSHIIQQINNVLGKEMPLTIASGLIHEELGNILDFSTKDRVMIGRVKTLTCMNRYQEKDVRQVVVNSFLFTNVQKFESRNSFLFHYGKNGNHTLTIRQRHEKEIWLKKPY
jgi:hypothetical protein